MTRVKEALNLVYHGVKEREKPELFRDVAEWLSEMCDSETAIGIAAQRASGLANDLADIDGPCGCVHGVPEGLTCAICGPIRNDDPPTLAPARVEGQRQCVKCGHAVRNWHGFCQFRATDDVVSDKVCGCECEFTIASDSARRAAERATQELKTLIGNANDQNPSGYIVFPFEKTVAVILTHFAAAPADNDAEKS